MTCRSAAPGAAPSLPYAVNSAAWDEFDAWVYDLRDSRPGSRGSYLPANLTYYDSTLEAAGSWSDDDTYGAVWYPHVAAGWYPYSHGSWSVVGRYGWVWVGAERWCAWWSCWLMMSFLPLFAFDGCGSSR